AVPPAGQGLHETRLLGGVAESVPEPLDGAVEADVEVDEGIAGPEGLADLLPCHDLARTFQEEGEDLKGLLLQPDLQPFPVQLPRARIELEVAEAVRRAGGRGFHAGPCDCNPAAGPHASAIVSAANTYLRVRRMSAANQPPAMVRRLRFEQLASARAKSPGGHVKHAPSILVCALALSAWATDLLAACPPPAVGQPPAVMCGLDNPRGLAFGAGGVLFVAEAGHGGAPCPMGTNGLNCYGLSGAISRLWLGRQDRIVSELPP